MPGRRTCCIYTYLPLTLSGTSLRTGDLPTILYESADLTGAEPVNGTLNGLSPTRAPYGMERPGESMIDTTPFETVSRSTGTFKFFAASNRSASRASAAAVRTCGPPRAIAALEYVPP